MSYIRGKMDVFPEICHLIASAYNRVCIKIWFLKNIFFHFEVVHLKIQKNVLYVLGDFENHNILFKFIWNRVVLYHRHRWSGQLIPQKSWYLSG